MRQHPLISCLLLGLTMATLPSPVLAGDVLAPLSTERRANATIDYEQEWGKIAMDEAGTGFAIAWDSALFHTLWLRYFSIDGTSLSQDILVNSVLDQDIQDEPMMAMDEAGRVIVCWSDRHGYDGWQMGCFGRAYGANHQPLGPEFQITANETPLSQMSSQWEPMPTALPGGGWAVAFNGDQDGNAYMRYLDPDGTPRTGDLAINTFLNNGQTEAECAVSSNGIVLAIYDDFGGNVQAGSGQNLLARRFDLAGNALDPLEFLINGSTLPFDQYEPRIDADGQGRFVIVWEDNGNDGDGKGIYTRWIHDDGTPSAPEVRVNISTVGDQVLPEVAADDAGNFVVTWEERSFNITRIMARRFANDGTAGPAFRVSGNKLGVYERPSVAMDASGTHVVFCYSGPGVGGFSNNQDIYYRRYQLADDSVGPVADFLSTGTTGVAPRAVSFTEMSTGGLATSWFWDFGDGASSSLRDPSHVYTEPGSYSVTMVASGPGGIDLETKDDLVVVSPHATLALGDKVDGALLSGEVHFFEFEASAGTKLTLVAKRRSPEELRPTFRLLDPAGVLVAGPITTTLNENVAKLPKEARQLLLTGRYKLRVFGLGGSSGAYKLTTKAKAPKSFKTQVPITVGDPGTPPEALVVSAVGGAVVKRLIAKSQKPKGAFATVAGAPAALTPAVIVRSPSGAILTAAESVLNAAGTRLVLKTIDLPTTGDYTVELSGADGSVGFATIAVKLTLPKSKTVHSVP